MKSEQEIKEEIEALKICIDSMSSSTSQTAAGSILILKGKIGSLEWVIGK